MLGRWLTLRIGRGVLTLIVVFFASFLLATLLPGDPAQRLDVPGIGSEQAEMTRRALGLDQPWPSRMIRTVTSYLSGDMGVSISRKKPVVDVLAAAIPYSLYLGGTALLCAYPLAVILAIVLIAADRKVRRTGDRLLLVIATLPQFWLGAMLIFFLHSLLGWLPASHASPLGETSTGLHLSHLVLPTLCLALPILAAVARYQLRGMAEIERKAHLLLARALGKTRFQIVVNHLLRPSIGVVVILLGLDLPLIVSGAIVVEVVFSWPGIGRVVAGAILSQDYPLVLGASVIIAFFVVFASAASDLVIRRIDRSIEAHAEERP